MYTRRQGLGCKHLLGPHLECVDAHAEGIVLRTGDIFLGDIFLCAGRE
jgi:hypothetical protein